MGFRLYIRNEIQDCANCDIVNIKSYQKYSNAASVACLRLLLLVVLGSVVIGFPHCFMKCPNNKTKLFLCFQFHPFFKSR